jgi:hypothetical protein
MREFSSSERDHALVSFVLQQQAQAMTADQPGRSNQQSRARVIHLSQKIVLCILKIVLWSLYFACGVQA